MENSIRFLSLLDNLWRAPMDILGLRTRSIAILIEAQLRRARLK